MEENNELLKFMVDAVNCGQSLRNGSFSKQTVEEKIVSILNAKFECQMTYKKYLSNMK